MPRSSRHRSEAATLRYVATHYDPEVGARTVWDIMEPKAKFRGQMFNRLRKEAASRGYQQAQIDVEGLRADGTWYHAHRVAL